MQTQTGWLFKWKCQALVHSQGPFHFIPDTLPSSQARQSEVKVRSGLSCSLRGHCDRPQDLLKRNMTYAADCNSCGGLQESVSYQGAHFGHEHTCTAHHECIFLLRRRRTGGSCRTWALLTGPNCQAANRCGSSLVLVLSSGCCSYLARSLLLFATLAQTSSNLCLSSVSWCLRFMNKCCFESNPKVLSVEVNF